MKSKSSKVASDSENKILEYSNENFSEQETPDTPDTPDTIGTNGDAPVFQKGILQQIREIRESQGKIPPTPESETTSVVVAPVLVAEDVEGLVEIPFDLGAIITSYSGFRLSDKERQRLARTWLKPIERLCGKYQRLDLLIAVTTTAGIFAEKFLDYKIEHHNRTRDAKQRQNELSQESFV